MDELSIGNEIKGLCTEILHRVGQLHDAIQGVNPPAPTGLDDAILDYSDVCHVLHISIRHLRRLHKSEELQGFTIGRRRYYRSSEIQRYLKTREEKRNH